MYICVIILRHICLPACLHYSLGAPCHSLNIERGLLWHWAIFPSSDLSGGPAVNSSQVFGLRAAWAWHALCFWTGVSVFVPDRELEIRGRHFCTCIPFTFHLISLTIALPLQLSDTLVMLSLHALNCSCSSGDFFLCVCVFWKNTPRQNRASQPCWFVWSEGIVDVKERLIPVNKRWGIKTCQWDSICHRAQILSREISAQYSKICSLFLCLWLGIDWNCTVQVGLVNEIMMYVV